MYVNLAFLKLDGTELKNQRVSPMPQVWCKGEYTFLGKMKGERKGVIDKMEFSVISRIGRDVSALLIPLYPRLSARILGN